MVKGLVERLRDGETVVVGEGYIFEFQARGYLQCGAYVPEVVLEHPDLVEALHREYVHAGSDVVLSLTFYAHRAQMRQIGREGDLESINRRALAIARKVADETGTLMAGNICTTTTYNPNDDRVKQEIYHTFEEQIKWAVKEKADYIAAETFDHIGEARLALKAIKEFGNGLPAVITLANKRTSDFDGMSVAEACRSLEEEGAAVVGLNCSQGPKTMMPALREIKQKCKGPIAGLPVTFRTCAVYPEFQSLPSIDDSEKTAFLVDLDEWSCSVRNIRDFAHEAKDAGIQYLGLCCGSKSHFLRTLAEGVGKTPPASRFSPDMSKHYSQVKDGHHDHIQDLFQKNFKVAK